MKRASELFAITAIALFAIGLALRRLPASIFISVHSRGVSYAVPPEAGAFAVGALFGVFAFVYSLWMVRMNHSAAVWHFSLSVVGTLLLGIGIVATANLAKAASIPQRGISTTAVVGTLVGLAVFFVAQVVFLANLLFTVVRTTRTP